MDREPYERSLERLCGEVDVLRALILAIASELPERAMYHVSKCAEELRKTVDLDAARRPNDRRRDYSAGVWDTASEVEEVLADQIDEVATGNRIRTVQPYPIDPSDELSAKGF